MQPVALGLLFLLLIIIFGESLPVIILWVFILAMFTVAALIIALFIALVVILTKMILKLL